MSQVHGRAVVVQRSGGPEALALTDRVFTDPGSGSVRVAVEAAGVAYGDLLLREGLVPGAPAHPVPGYDAVGIVDAVGPGVVGLPPGTRVAVRTDGTGGYATHVDAPAELVVPVPESADAAGAVALVLNYVTAWQMLARVAPVGDGGTILVHSAAGGVGSALVELGLTRNLTVVGTASAGRLAGLQTRGIRAFDRRTWRRDAGEAAPRGFDAVFEAVGGRTSRDSVRLLGPGGQLVSYGASSILSRGRRSVTGLVGAVTGSARASAFSLFRRGQGLNGYMSAQFIPAHPAWYRADLTTLLLMLERGQISPAIADRFPLSESAEAHRSLARGVTGKIVLLAGE